MSMVTGHATTPYSPIPVQSAARENAHCTASVLDGRTLAELHADQWDRLVDCAIEDNAFLSRQLVDAHTLAFDAGDTRFIAIRLRETGQLVGLFPMRPRRIAGILPGIQYGTAINLYQVAGAPLVDREHMESALEAFFDLALTDKSVRQHWAFPHVRTNGAFAGALGKIAHRRGWETRIACTYSRATLNRLPGGFAAHRQDVVGKKRTKDIERNLRRLGQCGSIAFERADDADRVALRIGQFLEMEHLGWKGRAGTSFLSKPEDAAYARAAFAPAGRAGATVVDSLLLDGKPIAISINLRAGRTLFTPKCAFDETYRKYGPGLVLEYKVIERFHQSDDIGAMDAATTENGHVISSFWNGSVEMGTLVLGPNAPMTSLAASLDELEYRARQQAKTLLRK